jgi:hypothetical protein
MKAQVRKCCVDGCDKDATVEVMLYDAYGPGDVFLEQDFTCPYLCQEHALENESASVGERRPRGYVQYPYSNRELAQGFTVYRPVVSTGAHGRPGDSETFP